MTTAPIPADLPQLFCKPPDDCSEVFHIMLPGGELIIRSLCLRIDLDMIHDWAGRAYSKRFWQLDHLSRDGLGETYRSLLRNLHAHSFIFVFDGYPVAQVDIYQVLADELSAHVTASPNDCGIHLLMQPPGQSPKNLSFEVLRSFGAYFFSFDGHGDLYAEPDCRNALANVLAKKAGFEYLRKIQLSYKTANLYVLTKNRFHATHQVP
ncbi:MAG TPA: GNAT family N-acetyltransferase [Puia sp.]|nr:GNAT family N-acetyltransferase [Puia sp.]